MNQPPNGPEGDGSRGFAAAKGALLIGLAVVIGIVLLQQVDDSKPKTTGATTATTKPKTTTTTVHRASDETSTTVAALKTPDLLHIIVLNGGAKAGSAQTMDNKLRVAHYSNRDTFGNWTGHQQTGNSVLCQPGLDREAAALAAAVGTGTKTGAYPSPAPSTLKSAVDCIVVVGA